MKNKLLWLLLTTLIFSCSRSPENEIALQTRNFAEEVQLKQNLKFTFDKSVVDMKYVGVWDSLEFIRIEPEVAGRFKWTSQNELIFSPENGFAPSTNYQAEFTDAFEERALNKKLYLSDESKEAILFHTPYLKPQGVHGFWSRIDGKVQIKGQLHLNYPVEVNQLAEGMEVFLDDKKVGFSLDTKGENHEVIFMADAGNIGEEDVMMRVKVKKGLKILSGDYKTDEDVEVTTILPSRLRLEITDVEVSYQNGMGTVRVLTSQELVNKELSDIYSLSPSANVKASSLANGFELQGKFNIDQIYALTINKKAEGVLGGKLKDAYKKNIKFGEQKPSIDFTNERAIYLSSAGSRNIAMKIVNVPTIKVEIYKIYENNILAYMRDRSHRDWHYDSELDEYVRGNYEFNEDHNGYYSGKVSEQEINTASLRKEGGQYLLNLSIPQDKQKYRGIYFVKVTSTEERYLNAKKLVSISDVGIITKKSDDRILVMAHSLLSTKSMSNVQINLVSRNNQVIATQSTGTDGVVIFDKLKDKTEGFTPAMITATTSEDFNFVPFNFTGVETSRFDVGGKYLNESGFDAYIYSPRNIYRPGETADFNTIIRTNNWENVGEIPLRVKMVMPNGREMESQRLTTNKQGAAEAHFTIPTTALTGNYSYEVYNANGSLLKSYSLNVEEFMPDRIRLKPSLDQSTYKPGEKVVYTVEAQNFFGPPAANKKYEVNVTYDRRNYRSKSHSGFTFYNSDNTRYPNTLRQGSTNSEGRFKEIYDLPKTMQNTGMIDMKFYTTVFDESGRPVHAMKSASVHTQDVYFGINIQDHYVSLNKPQPIQLVALDTSDKHRNGARAHVEIIRYEWQSILENKNGYYRYRSKRVEKVMLSKDIKFSGKVLSLDYNPRISGRYSVRIQPIGASSYVSDYFYAYGWGSTSQTSFKVNPEGQIDITLDKEKYEVGEKAKALLKAPFSGKMLVSIERDDVLDYKVIEVQNKTAEFEFKVEGTHVPNIYLSATLFRPMDGSNMPLTVAHGYQPVMVENKATRIPVSIEAPKKSRSKRKQTIKIKTQPESDIEVTVAVVDEGILQLKHFATPDPHGHYYQKRALRVSSYDIYSYLFPELNSKKSSGGGASKYAAGGAKRANPLANKRVKLLAKWSGILHTNSQGEAEYELEIPQFNGEVRIMAVAYKNKAFGATDQPMTIADPIVINTALPRFLAPGDKIPLPVNISNTTGKSTQAKVKVEVSGPLSIDGSSSKSVALSANSESVGEFKVDVAQAIGQAKVKVQVQGLNETFTEELDVTIRPTAPLTRYSNSGMAGKGSVDIPLQNYDDMLEGTRDVELVVSNSPMVQFLDRFRYLIRYPHGCVEQTTSAAFPQLYVEEFLKENQDYLLNSRTRTEGFSVRDNVNAAIQKLSTMQRYNGAMSYWPGRSQYSWWGTVYAAHFLLEAKKAGYAVDQQVINKAISFLKHEVSKKQTEVIHYWENGVWKSRIIADRAGIYSLYVLAIAGEADRSMMNYHKLNQDRLSLDSRYLLGASYALIGDKASFSKIAPMDYPTEQQRKQLGGNFSSPIRNLAISLNALVESDPENDRIVDMAKFLSQRIKATRWLNTQELAFSMLALGKMQKKLMEKSANALVKANGKIIGRFDGKKTLRINKQDIEGPLTIEVNGNGKVFYFSEVNGISKTGRFKEEDNFLKVRRTFYDRFGRQITNNRFKQHDLIVVKVSVTSLLGNSMENVAITDMLPAGFEIENPRLNKFPGIDWIKNKKNPDFYDFRDDRANIYLDVSTYSNDIYYMVRAVSRGTFKLGPIAADAMYNGEYHSYHGGGEIVIE